MKPATFYSKLSTINLALLLSVLLATAPAFGECDFAKDIKVQANGVLYSFDCHREMGKIAQDNEDRKAQIKSYKELLDLKDLQIGVHKDRVDLWYETSKDLENRLQNIDRYNQTNKYLYFVGGVVMTVLAGWSIGQASK